MIPLKPRQPDCTFAFLSFVSPKFARMIWLSKGTERW
jgi:hypothetical protein